MFTVDGYEAWEVIHGSFNMELFNWNILELTEVPEAVEPLHLCGREGLAVGRSEVPS